MRHTHMVHRWYIPTESGERWAGRDFTYLWVKRIAELNAKLSNQLKERGSVHGPFGYEPNLP